MSLINKGSSQRSLHKSISSIYQTNDIGLDSSLSRSRLKERSFECTPNSSIQCSNHLKSLRDQLFVRKYSVQKLAYLSSIHSNKKDHKSTIFKLQEGTYDNLTYEMKPVIRANYVPKDQLNKNTYKFQLTQDEYFGKLENLPKANINPFHLIPDLDLQNNNFLTQQALIYPKFIQKKKSILQNKEKELCTPIGIGRITATNSGIWKGKYNRLPATGHDSSEFDLVDRQSTKRQRILTEQTESIHELVKNHPPNFSGKTELIQLAKCMMLCQHNSPRIYKNSGTISLGRSADQLINVSKFNDRIYYERVYSEDKRLIQPRNNLSNTSKHRGNLMFGRIAEAIVDQENQKPKFNHDPSNSEKKMRKNQSETKDLSIKRQNLNRNLASDNFLAHSIKIAREEYLEKIDINYKKKVFKSLI